MKQKIVEGINQLSTKFCNIKKDITKTLDLSLLIQLILD
jgi:hypothetical protein